MKDNDRWHSFYNCWCCSTEHSRFYEDASFFSQATTWKEVQDYDLMMIGGGEL